MSSSKTCHHCGSSEIDLDPSRGDAVCTNCGSVLEDNIIVSEVQFEENARGGTSSVGQFVSLDGKLSRRLNSGLHTAYGRESRAITLENGRKKIVEVAQQLRLNQHCIDTAFNFFKMAVHRRLTRGRRHCNVIAACLYIVCRTEGTPHMLLDFCDVLQINVYDLGKTYLRLSTALCINIPAIDPCLYIVRFAHRLDFGDKTHEVSMSALRLVQRMKRDWMHTGRRPAGLCGAALLFAARLHDFNRTVGDIIKVVKVCTATIRKRLMEFGDTPSSRLTLDEFMTIDLEEEQDPPAFKAARKKARLQQLEDQNKVVEATKEIGKLQKQIEQLLEEKRQTLRGKYANAASANDDTSQETTDLLREANDARQFMEEETIQAINKFVLDRPEGEEAANSVKIIDYTEGEIANESEKNDLALWKSLRPSAASLGLSDSIEECMRIKQKPPQAEDGELDLTGIDDDELNQYIMSDDEVKRKTDLWHVVNATYLEEQKEKEELLAKQKEENANKPEKKKRKSRKRQPIHASTAGEAIEKMLQEKKISTKINYDVLRSLNSQFDAPKTTPVSPGSKNPATVTTVQEDSSEISAPKTKAPVNKLKRAANTNEEKGPENKLSKIEESVSDVVIETGPVTYEKAAEELDEEEEEEDEATTTAQLLWKHRGEDGEYDEELEDYYD